MLSYLSLYLGFQLVSQQSSTHWILQINSAPMLFYLKWMVAPKQYVLLQILKDIFFYLSIRVKTPNLSDEERLIQQPPRNLKF